MTMAGTIYIRYTRTAVAGYNWTVQPGDTVEVTAGGNTVTTVVAELSMWADPAANTVSGRTSPGRNVNLWLWVPNPVNPCTRNYASKDTIADSGGNFSAVFPNFDSRAYAGASSYDANGNSTSTEVEAFYLAADFNTIWFGE